MAITISLAVAAAAAQPLPGPLAPDHPVRLNSFVAPTGGRPAPVELLGYDLEAGGERIHRTPLSYTEGANPAFTFYWLPREIPKNPLSVVLRITGSGPKLEQAWPLETTGWQVGVVGSQRVEFSHPRGRYSGKATLAIALRRDNAADARQYVLHTAPLVINASAFPSKVDPSTLRQMFGADVVPLNAAFRLGKGASVTVNPEADGVFHALAIVSATGYDGAPRAGENVCRVSVDNVLEAAIDTGSATAPNERLRYNQIGGDNLPVKVFSQSREFLDYVTVFAFNRPCRPREISFSYLKTKGVFDVKELALLKSHASP